MLPTPSTSHLAFDRIYEPAEDSFLLLDTLSSPSETEFLHQWFARRCPSLSPIVTEIGTGSGVILAFVNAHAEFIFGRNDILAIGVDANRHACIATQETVRVAAQKQNGGYGCYAGSIVGDLTMPLKTGIVDVLICNPPYVPTSELPTLPPADQSEVPSYIEDSKLLSLSYAGGADGMETTKRLLDLLPQTLSSRGVAYVLLCAQNKPDLVKDAIRKWNSTWSVETVGSSGKSAGWEKLQIIRIWRNGNTGEEILG